MAKIRYKGLDAYLAKLSALEKSTDTVLKAVLYDGAEIVADSVREGLEALPTSEHNGRPWFGTPGHPARGPSKAQKEGLLESFGITDTETDGRGRINLHIGFKGYNDVRSAQWPKGQPNQMVARSVESGTSFMEKHEVFKRTVAKTRREAVKAMEKATAEEIGKIMK